MNSEVILEVNQLYTLFPIRQGMMDMLRHRTPDVVRAVDGVSFWIQKGEVLALVGESGCGKTTIARTLIGLENPTSGEILFKGQRVSVNGKDKQAIHLKQLRQRVQVVFQDPYEFT